MINDEGETVDLYIPRKCAYTNKLITAKDHAAVQINVGHLNENGQYVDGNFTTFALAGNVRAMGQGDSALDTLWKKKAETIGQQ
ncbi:g1740 [Coccomyxa viridis]|uniref:40S ribosomal protein S21 n=1 Tax=Coccomyxa viridis TaxID=1274662 RepID=A0ABP1FIQ6_9CHLO